MINNNLFDIQSMLGGKFDEKKIFEIINNRFEEYKEAYNKSSNELMDEATEQLVEYIFQAFIKMDTFYESVLDYVNVTVLKLSGEPLEEDEKELNKELGVLIKTITDTIPHEKETHTTFLEFIKRIFNRAAIDIQEYLDDKEGTEEIEDNNNDEVQEEKHETKLNKVQEVLSNVKFRSPIQSEINTSVNITSEKSKAV